MRAVHAALRPGGDFLMVEPAASSHVHENIDNPMAPMLYACSVFHCMTVSLAQGGAGLGAVWGEEAALQLLREVGFEDIAVERIEVDPLNRFFVAHKH